MTPLNQNLSLSIKCSFFSLIKAPKNLPQAFHRFNHPLRLHLPLKNYQVNLHLLPHHLDPLRPLLPHHQRIFPALNHLDHHTLPLHHSKNSFHLLPLLQVSLIMKYLLILLLIPLPFIFFYFYLV